ncbi:hypothetical protein PsYK624_108630 [Phanerochaete sordida]|uniref:Heterokaryon incompatibility domain-containing protein n=1 Tax=Phanerochaete sordida TaxID=48140 RepID=A0A9P3LI09_9APHY|nr:hypothetical protein PsYK624_108630 [Phanerochaete sordida]
MQSVLNDISVLVLGSRTETYGSAEADAQHRRVLEEAAKRQEVYVPQAKAVSQTSTVFELLPSYKCEVVVPKQMHYEGPGAIPDELANTPCKTMGIPEMLRTLNNIHGTNFTLDTSGLKSQLKVCVERGWDFGLAYSQLRPLWQTKNFEDLDFSFEDYISDFNMYRATAQATRMLGRQAKNIVTDPFGVMNYIPPRRIWDLYSNRVVSYAVLKLWKDKTRLVWRVSHSWAHASQRRTIMTPVNHSRWPVPIPVDVDLEQVRIELLNCGAQYAWLDILCLRQVGRKEDEAKRQEEWRVDVPSIGFIYSPPHRSTRPMEYGPVACYFNGLGRPFTLQDDMFSDPRHWLNRAWTLQEHQPDMIPLGLTSASPARSKARVSEVARKFYERLDMLPSHPPPNIFTVLRSMQTRASENPVDKVFGLSYFLVTPRYPYGVPVYLEEEHVEHAWLRLLSAMEKRYRLDLVFLFPSAGNGKVAWAPSWQQVMDSDLSSAVQGPGTSDTTHIELFRERAADELSDLPNAVAQSLPKFLTSSKNSPITSLVEFASERHVRKTIDKKGELFARGYTLRPCIVRGLADVQPAETVRVGYVRVGGIDLLVNALHREPIPNGEYVIVGRDGADSVVWVIGKLMLKDERAFSGETLWVRKVSVLQMPEGSRKVLVARALGRIMSLRFD